MNTPLPNLLAALSLHLAHTQTRAVEAACGMPASAASALITIGAWPGTPIKTAARIAGTSHSAMVRICEALEEKGLIQRQHSPDGRQVALAATPKGLDLRETILTARAKAMGSVLAGLEQQDAIALHRIANRLLTDATQDRPTGDWICRLCDETACGPACPVDAEQRRCDARA